MAGEGSMENMGENMEKLTEMDLEKLANMDFGNMDAEDLIDAKKKLLAMLESDELSEDVREGLRAMLSGNAPLFGGYNGATGVLLAFGLAVITFSIILFFGYKLYKSIRDKEKKKEEKKKAKQQKKKK